MYSRESLQKCLNAYPEFMISGVIEKLNNLSPDIKQLFDKWLATGVEPEDEVNGYTYQELVHKRKFQPVNAFLTLDWLIKDKEAAIAALEGGKR